MARPIGLPCPSTEPNEGLLGAATWRQARAALLHPRFYDGFRDAQEGKPLDYALLDRLPPADQVRYENGRELAAECQHAGLAIRWPNRESVPLALKELVLDRARRRALGLPRTDPHRARLPRGTAMPVPGCWSAAMSDRVSP